MKNQTISNVSEQKAKTTKTEKIGSTTESESDLKNHNRNDSIDTETRAHQHFPFAVVCFQFRWSRDRFGVSLLWCVFFLISSSSAGFVSTHFLVGALFSQSKNNEIFFFLLKSVSCSYKRQVCLIDLNP